jgi:hypothetical protein
MDRANAWGFVNGEDRWSKIMNCKSAAEIQKKVKKKYLESGFRGR